MKGPTTDSIIGKAETNIIIIVCVVVVAVIAGLLIICWILYKKKSAAIVSKSCRHGSSNIEKSEYIFNFVVVADIVSTFEKFTQWYLCT